MGRPFSRAHPHGRPRPAVRSASGARPAELRHRVARLAARQRKDSARRPARMGKRLQRGARPDRRDAPVGPRTHRTAQAATARRRASRQHPLDADRPARRRPTLRRPGRRTHRLCRAGFVDAAVGRPAAAHRTAQRPARRLRTVSRVRPPRAGADRTAAHAAPDSLQRLARPALGRPDLPDQLSLVRLQRLLEGPDPHAAGASWRTCIDGAPMLQPT